MSLFAKQMLKLKKLLFQTYSPDEFYSINPFPLSKIINLRSDNDVLD
jgi:hypothetical protein